MKGFSNRFIAVGVTDPDPEKSAMGVVVYIGELGRMCLDETAARKLADDILRNANHLWPIKESGYLD